MKAFVTTLLVCAVAVHCNQIPGVSEHIGPLGHVFGAMSDDSDTSPEPFQDPISDNTSESEATAQSQSPLSPGADNLESKRKLMTYLPATYENIDLIQVLSGGQRRIDTCLSHLSIDDLGSFPRIPNETVTLIPFEKLSLWPMSDLKNKVKCKRIPTDLTGFFFTGVLLFKFSADQLTVGRDGANPPMRQLSCSNITMTAENPQYPSWLREMFREMRQSELPSDETAEQRISEKQGDSFSNRSGSNNTPPPGEFRLLMTGNIQWSGLIPENTFSCATGNETHLKNVTLPAYSIFALDSVNFFNAFAATVKAQKETFSELIPRLNAERLSTAKRLLEGDPNLVDEIGHYFLMIETKGGSCMYVQPRAAERIRDMLTITLPYSEPQVIYNTAATGNMDNISITHLKPCPCSPSFPESFRMRISGRRAMNLDEQLSRRLSSSVDARASSRVINGADGHLKMGNTARYETWEEEQASNVGEMTIDLDKTGSCKVLNATRVSTLEKRLRNAGPPYHDAMSMPVMAVLLKYFQEATGDLSIDGLELLADAVKLHTTLHQMREFGATSVLVVIKQGSKCGAFNVRRPMAVLFEHRHIIKQMKNSSFMRALSNMERAVLSTTIPMSDTIDRYTAHLFIGAADGDFIDDMDNDMDDGNDEEDDDEDGANNNEKNSTDAHRQISGSHRRHHYGEMLRFDTCAFTASRRARGLLHDMCRVFEPLGMFIAPPFVESPSPSMDIAVTWIESPEPLMEAGQQDPSTTVSVVTDSPVTPSQQPGDGTADTTRSEESTSPEPEEAEATAAAPNISDPEDEPGERVPRRACFPAYALVKLATRDDNHQGYSGSQKFAHMDKVAVGDVVVGRDGQATTVIGWSHADARTVTEFIVLHTRAGTSIALTDGHYVPSGNHLVAAGAVTVGDGVELGNGSRSVVTRVTRARMRGLYSPVTDSGYVAVAFEHQQQHGQRQGTVVASCFTRAVKPDVATALAVPLRWAVRVGGICLPMLTQWLEQGSQFWTRWLPSGDMVVRTGDFGIA